MKILHVLHGYLPELVGGTERTVAALVAAMRDAGHDVVVVAGTLERASCGRIDRSEHDGVPVVRLHRDDVHFESWDKAWSPGVGEAFATVLEAERPDVVHVHHWIRLTSELVRVARNAPGAPIVAVTLHDYWTALASPVRHIGDDRPRVPEPPPWLDRDAAATAFAAHRADLAADVAAAHVRFAPSRAHADGLRSLAAVELGAVHVATPPLLDLPPRRPAATPGARGKRLLTWGSLYPDKGLELVLDALHSIGGGWSLDVLGEAHDPAYRELLEHRCEHVDFVRFHGRFDRDLLASVPADYAVLPSACHESYGLVLDEALCMGLPVLAADLPAYREHAPVDACTFFAPNDPGALAMALLDEDRLQRLAVPDVPDVVTPALAAEQLLARYDEARNGEHAPLGAVDGYPDRARAAAMFGLAEARLEAFLRRGG